MSDFDPDKFVEDNKEYLEDSFDPDAFVEENKQYLMEEAPPVQRKEFYAPAREALIEGTPAEAWRREWAEHPVRSLLTAGAGPALRSGEAALDAVGRSFRNLTEGRTYADAFTDAFAGLAGYGEGDRLLGDQVRQAAPEGEQIIRSRIPEGVPMFGGQPVLGSLVELGAQAPIPGVGASRGVGTATKALGAAKPGVTQALKRAAVKGMAGGIGAMPEGAAQGWVQGALSPDQTGAEGAAMGAAGSFVLGGALTGLADLAGSALHPPAHVPQADLGRPTIPTPEDLAAKLQEQKAEAEVTQVGAPEFTRTQTNVAPEFADTASSAKNILSDTAPSARKLAGPDALPDSPSRPDDKVAWVSQDGEGFSILRVADSKGNVTQELPLRTKEQLAAAGDLVAVERMGLHLDDAHTDRLEGNQILGELLVRGVSTEKGTAAATPVSKLADTSAGTPRRGKKLFEKLAQDALQGVVSRDTEGTPTLKVQNNKGETLREFPLSTPEEIARARTWVSIQRAGVRTDPAVKDGVAIAAELLNPRPGASDGPSPDAVFRDLNVLTGNEPEVLSGRAQDGSQIPYLSSTTSGKTVIVDGRTEGTAANAPRPGWVDDFHGAITQARTPADLAKIGVEMGGGSDGSKPVIDFKSPDSPAVQLKAGPPQVGETNIRAPVDAPPPITDAIRQDVANTQKLMKAATDAGKPGLMKQLLNGALHDIHRGPREIRERLQQILGARALNRPDEIIRPFVARLPKKDVLHKTAFALKQFQQGKISIEDLVNHLPDDPKLRANFADFAKRFTTEIADNNAWFEARGLGRNDKTKAMDELAPYLGRFYYAFMLPKGEWARIVANAPEGTAPHNALVGMVAHLQEEAKKTKETLDTDQLWHELLGILHSDNPMDTLRDARTASTDAGRSKAFDRLRQRKKLPEPFRKFLGEEENGVVAMGYTIAHQRQLRAQIEAWDQLATDVATGGAPPVLSKTPVPGWLPIEKKNSFGLAQGMYAHPGLKAAIEMPMAYNHGFKSMHWLVSTLKYAQVVGGGPTAYVNNFMRNLWGAGLSGLFDPLAPHKFPVRMNQAVKALTDYYADPKADSIVIEARKYGALSAPFGRTEIAQDSYQKALVKHLYETKGAKDGVGEFYKTAMKWATKAKDWTTAVYDGIDQMFKLATFIQVKNEGIAKGLSPEDAARLAARRINDSYPNFEHIGSKVDTARRIPVLFNTYLSGHAEELRVLGLLGRRFKEEPGFMTKQVLGMAGYTAGIYGGLRLAREWMGIGQQEIEQIEAEATKREQVYRPNLAKVYLPWRDGNGVPIATDLSTWFMPLQMLQGHPDDSGATNVAANLVMNMFGDLPEFAMRGGLEKAGVLRPTQSEPHIIESDSSILKGVMTLWKNGYLGPTVFPKIGEALHRAGAVDLRPRGRFEEQLTPGVAASQLFAPVLTPHKASGPNAKKQIRELKKDPVFGAAGHKQSIKAIMHSTRDKDAKKALIKEEVKMMKEKVRDFREKKKKKIFK